MLADCGPIKRIDLIKTTDPETGAKHSRGFGFVTFALEADAAKAVNTVDKKRWVCTGASLAGEKTGVLMLFDCVNVLAKSLCVHGPRCRRRC